MDNKDLGADPAFGLRPEPVALSRPNGFNRGEGIDPCPFCGAREDSPIESVVQLVHVEYHREHNPGGDWWTVQCDGCTATMGQFSDPDAAIEAWNKRDSRHSPEGPRP
jgi:hypothetical protein